MGQSSPITSKTSAEGYLRNKWPHHKTALAQLAERWPFTEGYPLDESQQPRVQVPHAVFFLYHTNKKR